MDVVAAILSERDAGVVRCGISAVATPKLSRLAEEFGLNSDSSLYAPIDARSAFVRVRSLLHEGLATRSEILPLARASELAAQFLALFGTEGVRYFSNGELDGEFHLSRWDPVTEATFDTGVLVLGPHRSGCLWVLEED